MPDRPDGSDVAEQPPRTNRELEISASESSLALRLRIAEIFLTVPDVEMYSEVLKVILEAMRSPFGVFGYLDEVGAMVIPAMTRHVWDKCQIPEKTTTFPRETWGDSTWPRAIREKRTILVNEPSTNMPEGHLAIRRHISVPILFHGEVIGLFLVANKETDYTEQDLGTLEAIAGQVAPILNARLQNAGTHEKLAHMSRHHELILNAAAEGILGLDMQGTHTFVNAAAAMMLGYESGKLLGRPSHSTWHHTKPDGSPYPAEECQIYAAFRDGVAHRVTSEVFWRKNGTSFPVEYASTPLRDKQHLIGAVVTFVDSTARLRSAEEKAGLTDQLRQALKMESVGQLAGGVAHDFNNMMAIVLGYGDLLLSQLHTDDPARKMVEQIVAAGLRSAALTRQLLAFSRKQILQPEVLDLNDLVRNFEKMIGRMIREDIELEFRLAATQGRVNVDPGQIEQVVANLVLNARDAMPLGGKLKIETADVELDGTYTMGREYVVPGMYIMLAVTDTGCGMDKATMSRIFEPFFTTKQAGKGTGLGLATAYGIVKQSGGYLYVYSEPGQGATFKIYLPRTETQPAAKAVEELEKVPQGTGERILLVEDEAPLRELCETLLTRLGYRVIVVENGQEAILLVKQKRIEPALVLTDVIMPVMSGPEMVEQLRRDRPDLKVIYMSGYPAETLAPHGVGNLSVALIQKPFTERTLAVKVRAVLGEMPRRRILMIDDDEQFRDLTRHFCMKQGHCFVDVDSAAAALTALAEQAFDVLLVDMNIPGTDGMRVLREIRAAGHTTPAILLTGDVASADMDALFPLGVVLALAKSSTAEPLLEAIETASSSTAIRGSPTQAHPDGGR